jgi:hypothetical protein
MHEIAAGTAVRSEPRAGVISHALIVAVIVAKRQRVWLRGNAPGDWALCLAEFVDANSFCGNVDAGFMCDVDHTCADDTTVSEVSSLSHIVDQRPMLRVSGEILLAFCFATPLVLLLCFLV